MSRYFWSILTPPHPVTLCHTSLDPQKSTSHISDLPIFSRPSTKIRTKAPCPNSLPIVREGYCPGAFVHGSFVWKVFSELVFVRTPFCQNTSVTNRKLKISLNFMFHM